MRNIRRILTSLLAFIVLSVSYQSAVASIPTFLVKVLDAAHVVNSLIPSGAMVNSAEKLLQSCFGIFGGPESLPTCVESLASAGGASASQQADLKSIAANCTDVASPACIEAVAFSDAGTDILGEILPGADILINIVKMIDTGDLWGLVSKVGIDVACIAAEVMTGGVDVCGAIKFVGEAVAAVVGAIGDAVAWVGDWLFGDDKDPNAELRAQFGQKLDTITAHGQNGLTARLSSTKAQDAASYVESLRPQVVPNDLYQFHYAKQVWDEAKAPMVKFINDMWVLEVTGGKGAGRKASITDREAFKQQYYLWWASDAKSGNAERFKAESLDCLALFEKFRHIDAYIAKPVGPPVQAQATEQFCAEPKAKYLEFRKAAVSTDLKNDTASKEQKLLGMKCVKKGNDYACSTWPADYACKTMEPKTGCTVDARAADEELAGRGVAAGNNGLYAGLGVGLCRRSEVTAMCYRDLATARCKALLQAEKRSGASKAACTNQYDTAYAKLVMQTNEVVAAMNAGHNIISKTGGGSAESNAIAQVCGGPNCVKVWDKDPLVIEYRGGKVNSLPAGTAIFYDAGKRLGNSCEMVSGTNNEVPQLCFGKLVSGDKPSIGSRLGDIKTPGAGVAGGGNVTQQLRDSLGRDLGTGAKLGGKAGDVAGGKVGGVTGGKVGDITGGKVGTAAIDLKSQGQLDARKLDQQMAAQKNLQQQLNAGAGAQQQQQTMGGKAPAGTGFGSSTASGTTGGTASTFNKAPTSGSLPKGGSIGGMTGGNVAGGGAASGGGIAAITAGMSNADRQAFAISCTASPMGSRNYACSSDRSLAVCQTAARNPALGLTCSKK